jgi:hypothetical protein
VRTYDDLCAAVASCGIPYARIAFDKDDPEELPELPYVLMVPRGTRNFMANNRVVSRITSYDVELYARGSSIALEETVDAALSSMGFPYQRSTVPLEDNVVELVWKGIDCIGS